MRTLSVVIPIKDECANLRPLHEQLCRALDPLCVAKDSRPARLANYEMLFVDDGSKDGSFAVLQELASVDPRVKVICLRRNFGQTLALRANRQDHFLIRKLPSSIGNWLIRCVTGVRIRDMGCTLRALRRDLAEALPLYGELHRFVPVLAQMHGARIVQIPVRHHPRIAGKTKYGLTRTIRVLLDLITVKFLHSYLTRPMHVLGLAGLVSMGLGGISLLATMAMKYLLNPPVFMTGNPLLLLSVMLELVGIQFISLGLLGEVLTRTYFESQGKSAYTVRATLNLDAPEKRRAA